MRNFEPKCMATALPTMPHRDAIEACRSMLENFPEAPCVPRLSMSARMYMGGMPCLVIDKEKKRLYFDLSKEKELEQFYEKYLSQDLEYFAIDPKYGSGFYALIDLIRQSRPPQLKLIHTQMPGVVTWGLSLKDLKGIPAWYDMTMRDVLIKLLIMKAKWQERKLWSSIPGIKTMITLGEPSLGFISSPFGSITEEDMINSLNEVLQNIEGLGCVHCCSNMDWSQLMKTKTHVINFDAFQFSEKFALYPREIRDFLQKGGMLAWGIVPVNKDILLSEDGESLLDRLEKGMALLVDGGVDKQLVLNRSFITPSCVTSTLSLEQAERVFHLTKNIGQAMREKYFSD